LALLIVPALLGAQDHFFTVLHVVDNEWGYGIAQAGDGGLVACGEVYGIGGGYGDASLTKFTAQGDHVWTTLMGGESIDRAYSVTSVQDGGYAVVGQTLGFSGPNYDLFLSKFNASGDHLWTKTLEGAAGEEGFSVIETDDGNLVVGGSTQSYGSGGEDLLLMKLDPSGTPLWARTLDLGSGEVAHSVIELSYGGFAAAGRSSFNGYDILLSRFDASGDHIWTRTLVGAGWDFANSVTEASDGGLVVAGVEMTSGAGGADLCISKFDSSGTHLWTRTLGEGSNEYGYSIVRAEDGGYVVTGTTEDTGYLRNLILTKFDDSGTHLWTRTQGGYSWDIGRSMIRTQDHGYAIVGMNANFQPGTNLFLSKFDSMGNSCRDSIVSFTVGTWEPTMESHTPTVESHTVTMVDESPTVTVPDPTASKVCPLCGDANDDGYASSADGYTILNYFGAGPQPVMCWSANVNGDADLYPSDGYYLLNYFGAGPALDCQDCEF
jgi:hypothetical protein